MGSSRGERGPNTYCSPYIRLARTLLQPLLSQDPRSLATFRLSKCESLTHCYLDYANHNKVFRPLPSGNNLSQSSSVLSGTLVSNGYKDTWEFLPNRKILPLQLPYPCPVRLLYR